jgi:hypothetical protein
MTEPDANHQWRTIIALARAARVPVEIEIEYEPPSVYAGRRARLFYDPLTDREGLQWLDH